MKVRTVKNHANDYGVREGSPYEKTSGHVYEVDDELAKLLIDQGIVEEAKAKDKA